MPANNPVTPPFSTAELHSLFNGLCAGTQALLSSKHRWAEQQVGQFRFEIKLGRGRRTYLSHRLSRHQKLSPTKHPEFVCVYGIKCIIEMFDPMQCQHWANYRELTQRGYLQTADAQNDLNPLTLLSHIVLHEFAHFEQAVLGQRQRGSVHNAAFYRLLDQLYRDGWNEKVQNILLAEANQASPALMQRLTTPLTMPVTATTLATQSKSSAASLASNFQRGQSVAFQHRGQSYRGTIVRLNKKRATIACPNGSYEKALVPYAQLTDLSL